MKKPTLGGWHLWMGLIFSIPIILVSVSAVFLGHKDLGKNVYVTLPTFLVPGMEIKQHKHEKDKHKDKKKDKDNHPTAGMSLPDTATVNLAAYAAQTQSMPTQPPARLVSDGMDKKVKDKPKKDQKLEDGPEHKKDKGDDKAHKKHKDDKGDEIKAALYLPDGTLAVGTKKGLYIENKGQRTAVAGVPMEDVKSLVWYGGRLFAAGKAGVYSVGQPKTNCVYAEDVHSLSLSPDGRLVLATKKKGLLLSQDTGRSWTTLASAQPMASKAQPPLGTEMQQHKDDDDHKYAPVAQSAATPWFASYELKKVMKDVHTGKAFFGKAYSWIWIDLIGLSMLGLTFTGVFFWWRRVRTQRKLQQAVAASQQNLQHTPSEPTDPPVANA